MRRRPATRGAPKRWSGWIATRRRCGRAEEKEVLVLVVVHDAKTKPTLVVVLGAVGIGRLLVDDRPDSSSLSASACCSGSRQQSKCGYIFNNTFIIFLSTNAPNTIPEKAILTKVTIAQNFGQHSRLS